jgi:ketosteroid isomerase-like protein
MPSQTTQASVFAAIDRINRSWLDGRPEDLFPLLHPDMTLVFPGFAGRAQGREAIVAGFVDFCSNAIVHEFREADHQADVVGDTAVVSFTYEMVYERSGEKSRATGRDLWIFARQGDQWLAIWRTMLDLAEQPV